MGLSGSEIYEKKSYYQWSWIASLIDYSIGTILSVPFCPLLFCPRTSQPFRSFKWRIAKLEYQRFQSNLQCLNSDYTYSEPLKALFMLYHMYYCAHHLHIMSSFYHFAY